jgi:hypothetical protein
MTETIGIDGKYHCSEPFDAEPPPIGYRYVLDSDLLARYRKAGFFCAYCYGNGRAYSFIICQEPNIPTVQFVCDACVQNGSRTDDAKLNLGNLAVLLSSLAGKHPEFCPSELETIADFRTQLIERNTPPILGLLGPQWPCHCGDYCNFAGDLPNAHLEKLFENEISNGISSMMRRGDAQLLERFRKYAIYSQYVKGVAILVHKFACRWCSFEVHVADACTA